MRIDTFLDFDISLIDESQLTLRAAVQSLRASEPLVHQIDSITLLNRTEGQGQLMITHSMNDLQLSTDELTKIAPGFVERSSVKIPVGLVQNEMDLCLCSRLCRAARTAFVAKVDRQTQAGGNRWSSMVNE
ncbi:hypothetical protein GM708_00145 [Vibrio cholerae]|nr:hypothetical protein [Vibrio cholerae]